MFDTPIGPCGVAWGEGGLLALALPERDPETTLERLRERAPAADLASPPADVQDVVRGVVALLLGEPDALATARLDTRALPDFHRRVYDVARGIPAGETLTYGEVAERLGSAGGARAVGQALGRNPFPLVVPCHRVLAAGGRHGGFTAHGGVATKLRILAAERAARQHGLTYDPRVAVEHLRRVDRELGALMDAVGPCTLRASGTRSVFHALAKAIVSQQLSTKAASTIFGRFEALFDTDVTAAAVDGFDDDTLRGVGLSRNKLLAIRDLAEKCTTGVVPDLAELRAMSDERIVERLTRVRGIGRWTVEMLLIFGLGRPDVWPVDDLGVRKGYAVLRRTTVPPTAKELALHAEELRPYRSVVSWYLWRASEQAPPR